MNSFLIKSWVYPFYKTYAGFLFVIFLFAAGFMRGEEHLALAFFFTSHIKNLIYPFAGFILYALLSIHFSIKWVSDSKNRILREVLFLDTPPRFALLFYVIFYLQIPAILYAIFLMAISIFTGQMHIFLSVILFVVGDFIVCSLLLNRIIVLPLEKTFNRLFRIQLPDIINFPIINFSLKHIFVQRLLSFSLTKFISIGLLFICILLFETIDNYARFASLSILMVFIYNAFLSFDLFKFHHIDLNFFRNLPIKPGFVLIQTLFIIFILTLPEIVIIYRNFLQIIPPGFVTIYIMNGLAMLLFLYAYVLYSNIDQQVYIIRIFWGSIFVAMLMLFDFPGYLFLLILCSSTFYFYFRGYYRFEIVYDPLK